MKVIYLVVVEDADPFCGVHPLIAFERKEDAERYIHEEMKSRGYLIQEIKLYGSWEEYEKLGN